MEVEEYLEKVEGFAQHCGDKDLAPHEFVESPGEHVQAVTDCVKLRMQVISEKDEADLSPYLVLGFFARSQRQTRIASFALSFDIQHALDVLLLSRQCELYRDDQCLFQNAPYLFEKIRHREGAGNPDYELIALDAIKPVNGSEIYQLEDGYARLTHVLNPGIVNWARQSFPSSPMFVRLDPHFFSQDLPRQYLMEATMVPANPLWLGDFSLRKRMHDFASYIVQDTSPSEDLAQFLDYRMRGIRRLEVRVERREDDYLTMMLEELPKTDDPNDLMVGRCIHLDTRNPVGTPLDQVELSHLDLAINVYKGEARQVRFDQTLQTGKVIDASFRTHIFRIEKARFLSLFQFCEMFFRSRILVTEWVQELTGGAAPA